MHKDDAGKLFAVLGDPNRVKIVKMLYHNTQLTLPQLMERMDLEASKLELHLQLLSASHIITVDSYYCSCNKELVDELMAFISTRCSCC